MRPRLNNAADILLALGRIDEAIELYGRAASDESPVALFNLAQAYGRAFRVEDLNQTITRAQRADGELIARLTALQGGEMGGFFADLPPASDLFWQRALGAGAGADLAREFRARFAPGWLGRDARVFFAVAALVWFAAGMGARIHPSRSCRRCGDRICRRCDPAARRASSARLHTLFLAPEKTDRAAARAARERAARARAAPGPAARDPLAVRAGRGRADRRAAAAQLVRRTLLRARRRGLVAGAAASCPIRSWPAPRGRRVPHRRGARGARLCDRWSPRRSLAPEDRVMSAGLSGNLSDFGIADVFQLIGQQRKTGVLELRSGHARARSSRFDRGLVVSAGMWRAARATSIRWPTG